MNSNSNEAKDNYGGKTTPCLKDDMEMSKETLENDASAMSEDHEGNGLVKIRNPVHRSNTEIQAKSKRPSRLRRKFLTWWSEDKPEKYAADSRPELDLGDNVDSTESMVDQLIEKLRREKLSNTPGNAEPMKPLQVDMLRNHYESLGKSATVGFKAIEKPRKNSLRKIFSWNSDSEDPCQSLKEEENLNDVDSESPSSRALPRGNISPCSALNSSNFPITLVNNDQLCHTEISPSVLIPAEVTPATQPLSSEIKDYATIVLEEVQTLVNFCYPNDDKTPQEIIKPILEELIATEESYVEILWNGIRNYSHIFERDDLPIELQGRDYELFANIEEIAKFHREHLLPMFLENRENAESLFEHLRQFVEEKRFNIYLLFTINKKRSMQLCAKHKSYFQHLQTELGDRLGISSFLLQPIQRMARYPLLLTEIIKSLFKHKRCPLLPVCCQLEHKVTNLLQTINASECINEIVGINMTQLFSSFRRFAEFRIYDYTRQRRYAGKLFLFDNTIIVTEMVADNRLEFQVQYSSDHVAITEGDDAFTLDYKGKGWDDCKCDFAGKTMQMKSWIQSIREIMPKYTITQDTKEDKEEEAEYFPRNHRGVGVFDVYDHGLARSYRCKIFLFAKCLTLAEHEENRTLYRTLYPLDQLGVLTFPDYFTLFRRLRFNQECDFRGHPLDVQEWSDLLRDLAAVNLRRAGSFRRKFGNAMNSLSPRAT